MSGLLLCGEPPLMFLERVVGGLAALTTAQGGAALAAHIAASVALAVLDRAVPFVSFLRAVDRAPSDGHFRPPHPACPQPPQNPPELHSQGHGWPTRR